MTDARLPERMLSDRRLVRLSDEAFRLYTVALLWSVANRTDGQVDRDDLALIPGRLDGGRADELCKSGLWESSGDGWLIVDYATTQTSRDELEVLENARRRERVKKARQRARAADDRDGPAGSPGGRVPGTAQEGQDRQEGQALVGAPSTNDEFGMARCRGCGHREALDDDALCIECVRDRVAIARAAS